MGTLLSALVSFLRATILPQASVALENPALRQQLAIYQRTQRRVSLRTGDRAFWVLLRRLWPGWERSLLVVRPETVIGWSPCRVLSLDKNAADFAGDRGHWLHIQRYGRIDLRQAQGFH